MTVRLTTAAPWPPRLLGALLCLGVTAIHVIDQGGFPGAKEPRYVGVGYYLLELGGVLAAGCLLAGRVRLGWFLALGVSAGPLLGYILSRGPGLPAYADDRGNWTEPLGLLSLAVEGLLLALAVVGFGASWRRRGGRRAGRHAGGLASRA